MTDCELTTSPNQLPQRLPAPVANSNACVEDCRDLLDQSVNLLEMLQCLSAQTALNNGAQHGVYLTLSRVIDSLQRLDSTLEALKHQKT